MSIHSYIYQAPALLMRFLILFSLCIPLHGEQVAKNHAFLERYAHAERAQGIWTVLARDLIAYLKTHSSQDSPFQRLEPTKVVSGHTLISYITDAYAHNQFDSEARKGLEALSNGSIRKSAERLAIAYRARALMEEFGKGLFEENAPRRPGLWPAFVDATVAFLGQAPEHAEFCRQLRRWRTVKHMRYVQAFYVLKMIGDNKQHLPIQEEDGNERRASRVLLDLHNFARRLRQMF